MATYDLQFRLPNGKHVYDNFGTDKLPPIGSKVMVKHERSRRETPKEVDEKWYEVIEHLYLYESSYHWNGNGGETERIKVVLKEINYSFPETH